MLNSTPTNLCLIFYGSTKYEEFVLTPSVILSPSEEEVTLLSENDEDNIAFRIPMYVCNGEIQIQPGVWVSTDDYRIATGPSPDSVVLIRKRNNRLEIVEYILNIQISYIKNFHHF